jgi:hypothetical protein
MAAAFGFKIGEESLAFAGAVRSDSGSLLIGRPVALAMKRRKSRISVAVTSDRCLGESFLRFEVEFEELIDQPPTVVATGPHSILERKIVRSAGWPPP